MTTAMATCVVLTMPVTWCIKLENNGVISEVMATPLFSPFIFLCFVYLWTMVLYVKSWQQSWQPSLFSPCLWLGVLIREQWCYMSSHGNPLLSPFILPCFVYLWTMLLDVKSWQQSWQTSSFSPWLWLSLLKNNSVKCEVMPNIILLTIVESWWIREW